MGRACPWHRDQVLLSELATSVWLPDSRGRRTVGAIPKTERVFMNHKNVDFEEWFEQLVDLLSDEGISFSDQDAVRQDYDQGKSLFDVVDDIKRENA